MSAPLSVCYSEKYRDENFEYRYTKQSCTMIKKLFTLSIVFVLLYADEVKLLSWKTLHLKSFCTDLTKWKSSVNNLVFQYKFSKNKEKREWVWVTSIRVKSTKDKNLTCKWDIYFNETTGKGPHPFKQWL